jgi:hypothetical protein
MGLSQDLSNTEVLNQDVGQKDGQQIGKAPNRVISGEQVGEI